MDSVLHLATWLLHLPLVRGLLVGAGSAAMADVVKILRLSGWRDLKGYDFGVASWHWFTGALTGAFLGAGLGAYLN